MANRDDHLAYGHYYNEDGTRGGQGESARGFVGDTFKKLKETYKTHHSQQGAPRPQQPQGQQPQPQGSNQGYYGGQNYNEQSSSQNTYGRPPQPQYQDPNKPQGRPQSKPPKEDKLSGLFGKLQGAVAEIGNDLGQRIGTALDPEAYAEYGQVKPQTQHRFGSFSPDRQGNDVKWYVDGCSYFYAVSKALESARESIWILDWWLSPELYLRRPPTKNEQYRLDRMLQSAAQRGVKVNIIVYKEVTQALTLSSHHTKHCLEDLHPNIAVFRHPDHLPDRQSLAEDISTSLHNLSLDAKNLVQMSGDAIKNIYGMHDDVVLYWAHHEKLCVIDGRIAFMGGLDMCFGRWDTNQHALADVHPEDINESVFPGQDYNNARVLDFQDVSNWEKNQLDRKTASRMGWSDISVSLHGHVVEDLRRHFIERWNFIYDTKYDSRKDARYSRLTLYGRPSSSNRPQQPGVQQQQGTSPRPSTSSQGASSYQQPPASPQPGLSAKPQAQATSNQAYQQSATSPQPGLSSYFTASTANNQAASSPQQPASGAPQSTDNAQNYTYTGQSFPPPPPGPPPSQSPVPSQGPTQGQSQTPGQSQASYYAPPSTQGSSHPQAPSQGQSQAQYYQQPPSQTPTQGQSQTPYYAPPPTQEQAGHDQPPQYAGHTPLPTQEKPHSQNATQGQGQAGQGQPPQYTAYGPPPTQDPAHSQAPAQGQGQPPQYAAYGPPPTQGSSYSQTPTQGQAQGQSQAPYFPPPPTQDPAHSQAPAQGQGQPPQYAAYTPPAGQEPSHSQTRGIDDHYEGTRGHGDRERGSGLIPRRFRDEFTQYSNVLRGQLAGQVHQYQDRLSSFGHPSQPRGNMCCQIVRSCSKWSNGTPTEHSIADAYAAIIRNSEHFVYIENQFFITATGEDSQKPVKNQIGAAIVERILRAARAGEKWKMIVVIPSVPCFAGDLADDSTLGTRAIMEFQYNCINRGGNSIMELVHQAGYNPMDYIRFYNLRNYDRINVSGPLVQAEQRSGVDYEDARKQHDVNVVGQGGYGPGAPAPRSAFDTTAPFQQYQQGAREAPGAKTASGRWDSVSSCYMLNGEDIRNVPWDGPPEAEIDAFVTEELYVHSKVMIADDRVVVCGSANLNDRSQLGDHDSEIAIIIEDYTPLQSTMNGKPWTASRFAASLRRQLFRKHLGLLPPQDYQRPDANFEPVGVPNDFDFDAPESRLVADPLADTLHNLWNSRANTNTEVFRKVFHSVPDDCVRNWSTYKEFYGYFFNKADKQAYGEEKDAPPARYRYGHVVRDDFPGGPEGVRQVKELLSKVKGTLVEMPLMFLIEEDVAKSGLALNDITEPLYT
ncbi:hypothetical protein BDV27DRAFT_91053 [Aspergillus caelatus]|uniref:phospholipase D n=1 Tax=Aspergillus caelatus TaxID=61420 RepID=A0A5N7A9L3_9EURO|nr:uncharacterized protein BDV27DRAFT_91053 [Aspergillus caelatus]KAE8366512.1 hypothetical protein BDV27DRAFT_91053 [Aspergillus caelatus]